MCPSIDELIGVNVLPEDMGFMVNERGARHANKYFDRGVRAGDVFYAPQEGSNAYTQNGVDSTQIYLSLIHPELYISFPRNEDLFSGRTLPWSKERR